MSHLFISYSRRDQDLAQRIVDALGRQNLETWIDWKSIPKGEDWEQEIYRGIEAADAFLFLISADSIKSVMCNREIVHAIKNNKRILPILLYEVDTHDFLDKAAQAEIKRLNWVFCRKDRDDFDQAMQVIQRTIRTDYDWLRFHTTLQTRALAWDRARRDGSRLLRGKELREAERRIAQAAPELEPALTVAQRQFIKNSRQSVRRRQAMPLGIASLLGAAVFLGGKFYFLVFPIADACPQVGTVSFQFEGQARPGLLSAVEQSPTAARRRDCPLAAQEIIHVTAIDRPENHGVELQVRLPETPAYRLDFLQEIREFGPELVTEAEANALLKSSSAYSIGEYQTALRQLEGYDSLSALTLSAQARLFADDLPGSRKMYDLALQKTPPNDAYRAKLYLGAALAWWRPQSYYRFSFQGDQEGCQAAARYYAEAEDWIESDKLAHNIRLIFAWFCIDENDPDLAEYVAWRKESPQFEADLNAQEAVYINAAEQYLLAVRGELLDDAGRSLYEERLVSARPLMLARATLSDFYWGAQDNCAGARYWRDQFRSGVLSNIEKGRLKQLLQSQPLLCK